MERTRTATFAALIATIAAGTGHADELAMRVAEGRGIASEFGTELRQALQAAMAEGGPLAAIEVCKARAPAIARSAGEAAGAEVGRTALRLRNPANAPDAGQRAVLESFTAELAASGNGEIPERLVRLPDGRLRYMRAILIEAPCLACHGDTLAEPVAAAIDALYPADQARGFRLGELRGAFTVTWPDTP